MFPVIYGCEELEGQSRQPRHGKGIPLDLETPYTRVSMLAHEGARAQGRMGREENRRIPH